MRCAILIGLLLALATAGCSTSDTRPDGNATTRPSQSEQVDVATDGTWSGAFRVVAINSISEVAKVGCTVTGTMTMSLRSEGGIVAAAIDTNDVHVSDDQPCPASWASGGGRLTGKVGADGALAVTDLVLCGVHFGPIDAVRIGPTLVSEFEAAGDSASQYTGTFTLRRQ